MWKFQKPFSSCNQESSSLWLPTKSTKLKFKKSKIRILSSIIFRKKSSGCEVSWTTSSFYIKSKRHLSCQFAFWSVITAMTIPKKSWFSTNQNSNTNSTIWFQSKTTEIWTSIFCSGSFRLEADKLHCRECSSTDTTKWNNFKFKTKPYSLLLQRLVNSKLLRPKNLCINLVTWTKFS